MTQKFKIEVRRVESIVFEVKAENYEAAREQALENAYDTNFHDIHTDSFYMTPDESGNWETDDWWKDH